MTDNVRDDDILIARIIGVDPGKATGIAICDLVHNAGPPQAHALLQHFAIRVTGLMTVPWHDYPKTLRVIVQDTVDGLDKPLVVACEKYVVTRLTQQSQDTQALEVTGALEAILSILEVPHTYCTQLPSATKHLMTDANMRKYFKFELKGIDGHARDALRQACTWAVGYVNNKVQLVES